MITHDEITITKYETEFVAKHKDYDVIGVGSNEFEAVLELSKALGALNKTTQLEHEALKKDVARLFELDDKPFELTTDEDFEEMKTLIKEVRKKVGKEE